MQAKILRGKPRRPQEFRNPLPASLRVILKKHLNKMARSGKAGLQLFRQRGNNGTKLFDANLFERPLKAQQADQAAVIGYQYAVIHRFQPAVAVYRPGKDFRQGTNAAVHSMNQTIKHYDSLFRTICWITTPRGVMAVEARRTRTVARRRCVLSTPWLDS